jgi:hypothetical protein
MGDIEPILETARQRDIRLLRRISERDIDSFSIHSAPPCPPKDLLALNAMLNENIISAHRMENGSGFPVQFLMVSITITGRSHLEELEEKESGSVAYPMQIESLRQQLKVQTEALERLRQVEHTLLNYLKLADWGERFGMVSVFFGVFLFGYLCAHERAISSLIDFIRSIKP